MFQEEARIIREMCKSASNKKILNTCSSGEKFYKVNQPYVWQDLLEPLITTNTIINLDIELSPGVDLVADVCDMHMIEDEAFDIVLFNSGIEHISEPEKACNEIRRVLKRKGIAIFSGPGVYPRHEYPIDNMLRFPTRDSWTAVLKDAWEIVEFRTTEPRAANPVYNFDRLVFASIVKCRRK